MGYWICLKFGTHDIYIMLHTHIEFYVNRTSDHRPTLTRSNSVRFAEITRKIPQKNQKNPTKEPEKSHGNRTSWFFFSNINVKSAHQIVRGKLSYICCCTCTSINNARIETKFMQTAREMNISGFFAPKVEF